MQPALTPIEENKFEAFALTAAQVGATLLALYFATVGVVASTAYIGAPNRIRGLFVRERSGQFYSKCVALLVTMAFIVIIISKLNIAIHASTIVALGVVSIFAVLSLLVLGVSIFSFMDPFALIGTLQRDFQRLIRLATRGRYASDTEFQVQYHRRASELIRVTRELAEFISTNPKFDHGRMITIVRVLGYMQVFYLMHKSLLTKDSRWFPRNAHHGSWLTADYFSRSVALQTHTAIDPRQTPDRSWLERALSDLSAYTIGQLISVSQIRYVIQAYESCGPAAYEMGGRLQVNDALHLWNQIGQQIWPVILQSDSTKDVDEKAALADTHIYLLVQMVLGLGSLFETINNGAYKEAIDNCLEKNATSSREPIPLEVLATLDELMPAVAFEREAEGVQITPKWFLRQLIARRTADLLIANVKSFIDNAQVTCPELVRSAISKQEYEVSAALIFRALELCNKARFHNAGYVGSLKVLEDTRKIEDDYWPQGAKTEWADKTATIERELFEILSSITHPLSKLDRREGSPDWFGRAQSLIAERQFDALLEGDEDLYRSLFPAVFTSILQIRDRIMKEVPSKDPEIVLAYAADPLIEIAEMSGYALLISELDGSSFWDVCRTYWDEHLGESEKNRLLISQIAVAYEVQGSLGAFRAPGAIQRSERHRRFNELLSGRGIVRPDWVPRGRRNRSQPSHPSPIIRAFAPSHSLGYYSALHIFVVKYLSCQPEWSKPLSGKAKSLAELISHESEGAS